MILGDSENHRMASHPWDAASCTAILPCVAEPQRTSGALECNIGCWHKGEHPLISGRVMLWYLQVQFLAEILVAVEICNLNIDS